MNFKIQSLLLFPSGGQKQPVSPCLPTTQTLLLALDFLKIIIFLFIEGQTDVHARSWIILGCCYCNTRICSPATFTN